jgi:hypothetical protein
MNAYKRRGLDESDLVDFRILTQRRRRTRLRVSAFYLNGAAGLRREIHGDQAARFRKGDYRTPEDFKRLAFRDAHLAKQWRLELQGAL